MRRAVAVAALLVAFVGCSESPSPEGPPGLQRIDGPARVDPSFDPFATTTPATVVDGGG